VRAEQPQARRARSSSPRAALSLGSLALACLAACGSETLSLGAGRSVVDAGASEAGTADAALDAQRADATAADANEVISFSPPSEVPGVKVVDSKDDDPSLTRDQTLLYFDSRRPGGTGKEDIWQATRSTPSEAFGAAAPVAELNTSVRETGLALSSDGLRIWFSSDRDGGAGGLDVYTASRSDRASTFRDVTRVPELCTEGDDLISAVDDAQETLWLARRDDDDDDYDLFVARRSGVLALWQTAVAIEELNSDKEESDAFAVRGGQQLIFTRSGDLYLSVRARDGRYGTPEPLVSVNSEKDDRDAWASDDLRLLVFSSNRTGEYLLYQAER
jgi:hypothetical protein